MLKRTVVDQIEIDREGTIRIRMAKEIVDGDTVVAKEWHRTVLPPGGDIDFQMMMVNQSLVRDFGYPAVSDADIARIRSMVPAIHTEEIINAYVKKLTERQKKEK